MKAHSPIYTVAHVVKQEALKKQYCERGGTKNEGRHHSLLLHNMPISTHNMRSLSWASYRQIDNLDKKTFYFVLLGFTLKPVQGLLTAKAVDKTSPIAEIIACKFIWG